VHGRQIDGLERAATRREAAAIWGLTGLARRAQLLQRYALYMPDPDGMAGELAAYRAVTPTSASAAVARWARPNAMVEVVTERA